MDKLSKIGLIIGLLITPIAIMLALASGGAGHGNYRLCFALYPLVSMIMFAGAGPFVAPLALAQYPFFGWYIGRCISRKQRVRMWLVILLLQVIPMLIALA